MYLPIPLWPRLLDLLTALEKEIPRVSVQCAIHIALVTTRPQLCHKTSLTKISQKLVDETSKARLKVRLYLIMDLSISRFVL